MRPDFSCVPTRLSTWLSDRGFMQIDHIESGCTFQRENDDTCLIIDTVICAIFIAPKKLDSRRRCGRRWLLTLLK